jgi:MSHA pilin protein MshB
MKQMKNLKKASGFTIIELVVVILLLGILTATALPRFMDVADEAHAAVVDGVLGGVSTGAALFRAQWMATGQPSIVTDFASLRANSSGFPVGTGNTALDTHQDCLDIYETLLQPTGRPKAIVSTGTVNNALAAASVTGIAADVDFVAHKGTAGICQYAYTGQFKTASAGNVHVINFNVGTHTITLGTPL